MGRPTLASILCRVWALGGAHLDSASDPKGVHYAPDRVYDPAPSHGLIVLGTDRPWHTPEMITLLEFWFCRDP